jgi:hypothetical protein
MEPRLNVYVSFIPDDEGSADGAESRTEAVEEPSFPDRGSRSRRSRKSGLKNPADLPITNVTGGARRRGRSAPGSGGDDGGTGGSRGT